MDAIKDKLKLIPESPGIYQYYDKNDTIIYIGKAKNLKGITAYNLEFDYSDVQIRGELMRRVTAPKVMYIYEDRLHVKRGGAIEGHPRGNKQYNDLSVTLVGESFFRGSTYSFGDKFIDEKSKNIGNDATPSTIPKALINAHITFMLNDFI